MKTRFLYRVAMMLFMPFAFAFAQEEADEEKLFQESMEKEISRLEQSLDLEDWQVFYVDSILIHDTTAMRDELKALRDAKVSNTNVYIQTQDKWTEKMYQAYKKIFDEKQWEKYLKSGAARAKKARDKRAAK